LNFSDIYINKDTNEFLEKGDVVKNLRLASTLRVVAKEGSDAFYSRFGSFAEKIVDDITSAGGIISMNDLLTYEPKWSVPNESKLFDNRTIHTFPLPTSGNIINFMMNVFNQFKFHEKSMEFHRQDKSIYHVMIEIFKFGFAMRTKIGDEESEQVLQTLRELKSLEYAEFISNSIDFNRTFDDIQHYFATNSFSEDHGTSQISILAPNGDAVAMTTTINGL
jgi:gamma-glutamyltranspeptidase / glutathione hydrolase / leukotriene-C4 hydrolase